MSGEATIPTTDRVRCVRISASDFASLSPKDDSTMYFVNETGSFDPQSMDDSGQLYLGDKLINIDKLKGQGYGTCSTSSGTLMDVTMSGYEIHTNCFVAVNFQNAVPASATMRINSSESSDAKPIYNNGAAITAGVIKAGRKALFLYDGTYYNLVVVENDGDNVKPNWAAASGTDAEILNKPNIKRGTDPNHTAIVECDMGNVASGEYAHAEGASNNATGNRSHAEGSNTTALGDYSHTEGQGCVTRAARAHAEGYYSLAQASSAHAEGIETFAVGEGSHAGGKGSSSTIQLIGSGTSYTASTDDIKEGDVLRYNNTFVYVTAVGASNSITTNSTLGTFETATNVYRINGVAYETCSHVCGRYNNAISPSSNAEGESNIVIGAYAHAEGYKNFAQGTAIHVEGQLNKATGANSHAEGYLNIVENGYSHAEGRENKMLGSNVYYSHVEGFRNLIKGNYAHAEGNRTTAVSSGSHTEGYGTMNESSFTVTGPDANGVYTTNAAHGLEAFLSTLMYGDTIVRVTTVPDSTHFKTNVQLGVLDGEKVYILSNVAHGSYSHTEGGAKCTASQYSHAEGMGTATLNAYEHAEGRYNKSNNSGTSATQTRHSIGIGTGEGSNRMNALEIMANGDTYLYGVGSYDGKNSVNAASSTLQDVLNRQGTAITALQHGVDYYDRVHIGAQGLLQNSLCAFNMEEELVSLVYLSPKDGTTILPNTIDRFPYGAKIYYYTGTSIAQNVSGTDASGITLYSSYKHADMSKMLFGATTAEDKMYIGAVQSGGTSYVSQSTLYLNVDTNDRYGWYVKETLDGEIIVPYRHLSYDEVVIRLGCHNATATTDSDWYSMNLEDNNPMYKLELDDNDDPILVEYNQSLMYYYMDGIKEALEVIINGQSANNGGGGNS